MEPTGPGDLLAQIALLALIVQWIVDRVRLRLPKIDGDIVLGVAVTLGSLIAWALELDAAEALTGTVYVEPLNWIVTGVAIGAGSGVLANVLKKPAVTATVEVASAEQVQATASVSADEPDDEPEAPVYPIV